MTARSKHQRHKLLMPLRPIEAGAGVSVVSPASFAIPERVDAGVGTSSRNLDTQPRLGANTLARGPLFFAGTPEQRLADLHAAFADPETTLRSSRARRLRIQLPARLESISSLSQTIQSHFSPTAT